MNPYCYALWYVFICFYVCLVPSAAIGNDRLTLERVFQHQAGVGDVLYHESGKIYFEKLRPVNKAPQYFAYESPSGVLDGLKMLMVIDIAGEAGAKPLFHQGREAGYRFAGQKAISPDGRYIGIFKAVGQSLTPGVFDTYTDKVKFFDDVELTGLVPVFKWVTEIEFVTLNEKDLIQNGIVRGGRFYGPRKQAASWEAAWRQDRSTSSVLGAGRYEQPINSMPPNSLVKINVNTGKAETVLERAEAWFSTFSPSGRFLLTPYRDKSLKRTFAIIDLKNNLKTDLLEKYNASPTLFEWSPESDQLLFIENLNKGNKKLKRFSLLNPYTQEVVSIPMEGAASVESQSAFVDMHFESIDRAFLLNDYTIVYAKSIKGTEPRVDWISLDLQGRETVLTENFENSPTRPTGRSTEELFFLINGDIIGVNTKAQFRNLTETLEPVSNIIKLNDNYELPFIDNIAFSILGKGYEGLIFLNSSGAVKASYNIPERNLELHYASEKAIIYSLHSISNRSKLVLLSKEGGEILWAYNDHLKGVVGTGKPIRVDYIGPDEQVLNGWLYLPASASACNKIEYPLVMIAYAEKVYGDQPPVNQSEPWRITGPVEVNTQLYTSAGYAVLLPSIPLKPRGEPSDPMIDMMPSIDAALDAAIALGCVDDERIALVGHSYGGYTALSVAVQSNRFGALIASASQSNLTSLYGEFLTHWRYEPPVSIPAKGPGAGVRDFGVEVGQHRMGGVPWGDKERYIRNSPLFHADNVETPVMLIHGDLDFVPMVQAEEMFTALARQGKDVQLVRYWGEPHTVLRPQNQLDLWRRIMEFFESNGITPDVKKAY